MRPSMTLSAQDVIGSSGRISEVMNKQRLPADVLIRSTGEGRSFVVTRAKGVNARMAM